MLLLTWSFQKCMDSLNNLSRLKISRHWRSTRRFVKMKLQNIKTWTWGAKFRLQVILVTVFIPMLFLVSIILSKRRIKHSVIKFLGVVSLMFAFEFITLLLHPLVENITGHNLFIEVFIFCNYWFYSCPTSSDRKDDHQGYWLITEFNLNYQKEPDQ